MQEQIIKPAQTNILPAVDSQTEASVAQGADSSLASPQDFHIPEAQHDPEEADSQQAELQQADPDLFNLDLPELLKRLKKLHSEKAFLKSFDRYYQYKNRFQQLLEQAREQARQKFLKFREEDNEEFHFETSDDIKEVQKLLDKIFQEIQEEKKRREKEMQQNLLKKQDILDEMRKALQELPVQEAKARMTELRKQWKETGPVPPAESEKIWNSYKYWNEQFVRLLEIDREIYEEELRRNLEEKEKILQGLENLLKMPPLKAVQYLPHYRKLWAEAGPVPKEKSQEIFEKFKELLGKIYERRNAEIQKLKELWQKNKEQKEELIRKAREITEAPLETFAQYKERIAQHEELLRLWKLVGRTSPKDAELLWNEFSQQRQALHKKWQELQKKRKEEWQENLRIKQSIIEEARTLLHPDNWKAATSRMVQLMEKWRSVGPVGKEHAETVWNQFREIRDKFYEARKAYYEEIPKVYQRNKEAKLQLIDQINNFSEPNGLNYEKMLEQVKTWRRQFQEIGHVALSEKAELEEKFNQAIQGFLQRHSVDRREAEKVRYRQHILELSASDENGLSKLKAEERTLRAKIERLTAEINQLENNLRFFQFAKNAEDLVKPYEVKLSQAREQLQLQEDKLKTLRLVLKKAESQNHDKRSD
ncbi:MAG: DUF349 domain-containing protein [Flavobacteriales bacterium]|nr:DUF349 domain-containing protein [Flavobacteriales bacterium]MCX7767580.1 DUF349 domain-containing protein [Flavobacteriales bacterium]MDW8410249.1 DUF349 domain-containing protein [Flavobacteriales bacterium]